MNKVFKRIAIFLVITFVAPALFSVIPTVNDITEKRAAAAETKLLVSDISVGINSSPQYIGVSNNNYGAVYTYTSANKKIATVNEYGYVCGKTKGKTTVSITERIDGVTTKLGTVKVSVVPAEVGVTALTVGVNNTDYIFINYSSKGTAYKYKSSNPKIAKVDQYGCVTGQSVGKTTITVTQTTKGKTTKLGSVTVTVALAKLTTKEQLVSVSTDTNSIVGISYLNEKATYKFSSSDAETVKVNKNGLITGVKVGKATISVSETYQKKTRKLGSVSIEVTAAYINPNAKSIVVGINSVTNMTNIIDIFYANWDAEYTCESADSKIVSTGYVTESWGDKVFKMNAIAYGETTITVYEKFNGVKRKVGTVKVTVKDIPVTSIEFLGNEYDETSKAFILTYYLGNDYTGNPIKNFLQMQPYNASTPITFTSSNKKVIKVDNNGYVTLVAKGTATITATCGNYTSKIKVVVKPGSNH